MALLPGNITTVMLELEVSSSSFVLRPITRLYQGLARPCLNWDGRDGLGHGVPVPGADGYEYVR